MALKFWLGGAASDKSVKLIEYVLDEAEKNPSRQYLVVVPEQICLAMQQEYVFRSRNCGILNIDILPFTRLAHRISDEVGDARTNVVTLDDMGKNLLLSHLASIYKDNLEVIGENVDKLGYIDKVKSAISEFMQYGISVEKASELASKAAEQGRGLLASKLNDVAFLYGKFKEYTKDRYTTVEETLDRTADIVHKSETIRNSVIVFDGFTGFTPVQIKLIGTLMEYAADIHVALLMEDDETKDVNTAFLPPKDDCIQKIEQKDQKSQIKEHELFYLSKRTVEQLGRLADERHIEIQNPYNAHKYAIDNTEENEREIVYKEKPPLKQLNNTPEIYAADNLGDEIGMVSSRIKRLIREDGYRYRDIAIITGDIEGYRSTVSRVLGRHEIPYFIDKTEPILMNPFLEYIRALISVFCDNYSLNTIFRYLKSGLSGFDDDDISILENYCIATGIKGYAKWHSRFIDTTVNFGEETVYEIENVRQSVIGKIDRFLLHLQDIISENSGEKCVEKCGEKGFRLNASCKYTVRDFATALYMVIDEDEIEERLKDSAQRFENEGVFEKKEEYSRVYVRFMDILDQLCELIPDEKVSIKEFGNLIDAALSEIRIGILPGKTDYVQVGDLTRSRLMRKKVLFIVGANDGIIPMTGQKGGILNDADKEFLVKSADDICLAPTAREDAYTQRLYLYMMMNAPSDYLILSYSKMGPDGKSRTPSYIIRKLRNAYHGLSINTESGRIFERIEDEVDAHREVYDNLNGIISGSLDKEEADEVIKLIEHLMGKSGKENSGFRQVLEYALLTDTGDDSIGKALANVLYGKRIVGSVTRLETYANCAYEYFLKYGMELKEREVFSFEANELGSIFHGSLSEYASLMEKEGIVWSNIEESDEERLMERAVEKCIAEQHMAKLYSEARTTYLVTRIKRIMTRTARVLKAQLSHGDFVPQYFEVDFDSMGDLNCLNIRLSDDEVMRLKGRIDRIDTASCEDGIYVKIIDYKSSEKSMDLLAVYEGRQLQLLTYLNAAMESQKFKLEKSQDSKDTPVLPAGILYYHIDDPFVSDAATDEEIRKSIMKALRMKGLINSDGSVAEHIDRDISSGSEVLSVSRKKDRNWSATSLGQLVSGADFGVLSKYVEHKIKEIGREILSGNIAIPKPDGKERFTDTDCKYCPYKSICAGRSGRDDIFAELADEDNETAGGTSDVGGFDTAPGGLTGRKFTNDEVITLMKDALGKE